MGALPLDGEEQRNGIDTEGPTLGFVTRTGSTVSILNLLLPHIRHELPALADWLGQHEGRVVRYDLREAPFEDDDEPGA